MINKEITYRRTPRPPDGALLISFHATYCWDEAAQNLRWRETGKPAGHKDGSGYRSIMLLRHKYKLHRVLWLVYHGVYPDGEIDHINGDPTDNRRENLRLATAAGNIHNRVRRGEWPMGVSKSPTCERWVARIQPPGDSSRKIYLGYYASPQEAAAAYAGASIILHGEFAVKLSREPDEFVMGALAPDGL
jgi:hypothetical protein